MYHTLVHLFDDACITSVNVKYKMFQRILPQTQITDKDLYLYLKFLMSMTIV